MREARGQTLRAHPLLGRVRGRWEPMSLGTRRARAPAATHGLATHDPAGRGQRAAPPTRIDLVAGVSVALVLIPQAIAYAALAGLPPQVGLLAAALPPIVASAMGSSTVLQTGPVALTSLLTLGMLSSRAELGSDEFVALAALLAVLIGTIRIVIGAAKLGHIAFVMTKPIIIGFTTGAAVLIMSSQIPTAAGRTGLDGHVLGRALVTVADPGSWHAGATALTVGAMAVVLAGRSIDRRIPSVLVVVVVGISVSTLVGYSGPTVGDLSADWPHLNLDLQWTLLVGLVPAAIVMALVDFAEPAAIARKYAEEDGVEWDANREFIGQGAANLVSGLSGGYPVGGSFSRSSLSHMLGATSRWTGIVSGVAVLAFLPFAGVLSKLPTAVLAGVIVIAVAGLFEPKTIAAMWTRRRGDALVALTTFALTIVTAPRIDRAIIAAVGLELCLRAYRIARKQVQATVISQR